MGLDVARCVALVGMIATHTFVQLDGEGVALPMQVTGGRSAALFAVLAGVTTALLSGGRTPVRGRRRSGRSAGLVVRAALIGVLGMLLAEADSGIAIILTYYAVLFLLALPFLGLGARALAALCAGWVCVAPVVSHLLRPHLPERGYDSPRLPDLGNPAQLLSELTFTGYYPAVPWLAYVLAGMAVGRLDLSRRRTAIAIASAGALLAASSWAASTVLLSRPGVRETLVRTYGGLEGSLDTALGLGLHGTTPTDSWWWLAVHAPHSSTPFALAHTIGTALLVIGLCLLVAGLAPAVAAVVFGAGAMSLSLYTLHVLLRTPGAWYEDGTGTFWRHVAVVLVVGAAYRLFRQRGPLERLVGEASRAVADRIGGTAGSSRRPEDRGGGSPGGVRRSRAP